MTTTKAATVPPAAPFVRPCEVVALGSRFIDGQPPSLQRLPIQALDDPLSVLAVRKVDKAKAS